MCHHNVAIAYVAEIVRLWTLCAKSPWRDSLSSFSMSLFERKHRHLRFHFVFAKSHFFGHDLGCLLQQPTIGPLQKRDQVGHPLRIDALFKANRH